MVDPERVDPSSAPAFGPGAAHLRATVSAASQLRPRSFGGFGPPIADRTGVQHSTDVGILQCTVPRDRIEGEASGDTAGLIYMFGIQTHTGPLL